MNRFAYGYEDDAKVIDALAGFKRFPTWMWRNSDVVEFVGWLREHNDRLPISQGSSDISSGDNRKPQKHDETGPPEACVLKGPRFEFFQTLILDAIGQFYRLATDFAILNIGLRCHGCVQNHGDRLPAIGTREKVLHAPQLTVS